VRQKKKVTVTRGCLTGEGATKTLAKADLEQQINKAVAFNNPHIECWLGHVIVVTPTARGWETFTIHPDQINSDAQASCCTFVGWEEDRNKIIDRARLNVAMSAWDQSVVDDEYVEMARLTAEGKSELASWIKFQRRYQAAKIAGKTDAEAFDIANGRVAA